MVTKPCAVCDDTGWVCEAHPDRPSDIFSKRFDACQCGGAGMPCETCNPSDKDHRPDMSRTGFLTDIDERDRGTDGRPLAGQALATDNHARWHQARDGSPRPGNSFSRCPRHSNTAIRGRRRPSC
jgi:hypothetical protein